MATRGNWGVGFHSDWEASLVSIIRTRGHPIDLSVLALPLVGLIAVYLLPSSAKDGLVLAYRHPTIVTAFMGNFVHYSASHLIANLLGYVLIAPVAYTFSLLAGRRREFLTILMGLLIVYPFALSWLNVQLVRPRIGYGFSGILMGFAGVLTLALAWMIADQTAVNFDRSHGPLLYFMITVVMAIRSFPFGGLTRGALLLAVTGIVIYSSDILVGMYGRFGSSGHARGDRDVWFLILGGAGLVLAVSIAAFPTEAVQGRAIPNLYAHYLGYGLGFIVPFATFQFEEWLEARVGA